MFQTILIVLFILWFLGFNFNIGGNLIHTLLAIALIVIIAKFCFNSFLEMR